MYRKFVLFAMLLVILAACQAAPTPAAPTATPFPDSFVQDVKLGENLVTITCQGSGKPTILLENGLDMVSWPSPLFASISRTCIYSRVGSTGESVQGPRTTLDQVNDLHQVLTQTGVPGPYILVGHSIASYNLLLYTNKYPAEVVGLVCVDCRPPGYSEIFYQKAQALIDSTKDNQMFVTYLNNEKDFNGNYARNKERLLINESEKQALQVTSLGDRPFVVLVRTQDIGSYNPYVVKFFQIGGEVWTEVSQTLVKLSTQARLELVPDTNHQTIPSSPAVAKAVQEVVDRLKKK